MSFQYDRFAKPGSGPFAHVPCEQNVDVPMTVAGNEGTLHAFCSHYMGHDGDCGIWRRGGDFNAPRVPLGTRLRRLFR